LTPYHRATLLLILLAEMLASHQPRGGPPPRLARPASARLPRRALPAHESLAGRRPRG
jgi:hypothetical protein